MTFTVQSERFRAEVETVTIQLERRFDYDPDFMCDRFVYLARSGDRQGYSALGLGYGALDEHRDDVNEIIGKRLPDMRRIAIDGALQLGYEAEVRHLGSTINLQREEMREMQERINTLQRPWWRKTYEKIGSWISGVR